ncbi:SRPBCC family protein [Dehalogenimonas etheniformans]|uniref:SRPBCC domain-containing protein n=1 Tax=Dehalogenimonas etheniformans TaxID=1536648 RepID=A0A2P5P6K9_9CHLR|nr:SRPBCC domain-containing protein [Dehalogenimonas etheniformans]PPD57941.1 SRPBCC domain-containing protein [Dehalogenimonas etheniformans]QNT75292.1 SRPBCC domain-containing protein [Dehalogenimonas etheniformans]
MSNDRSITVTITIKAPIARVWRALVDPELIKEYMGGAQVVTEWKPGGTIFWEGLWQGQPYRDKGQVIIFEPESRVKYTHYAPATGLPDRPENYHVLTYSLSDRGNATELVLLNENITTEAEQKYLESGWKIMLEELRRVAEQG